MPWSGANERQKKGDPESSLLRRRLIRAGKALPRENARYGCLLLPPLVAGSDRYQTSSSVSRARSHIHHPFRLRHRPHVVLDHHHGVARSDETLQLTQQPVGISSVQAGGVGTAIYARLRDGPAG